MFRLIEATLLFVILLIAQKIMIQSFILYLAAVCKKRIIFEMVGVHTAVLSIAMAIWLVYF